MTWVLIIWILKKSADLILHCFKMIMMGSEGQGLIVGVY